MNNQAIMRDAGLIVIEFLMKYYFYPEPFSLLIGTLTMNK